MVQPKRITGFMVFASELIADSPGLTAQEVFEAYDDYCAEEGIPMSAAADKKGSLVCTLHKCHKDFGLQRIKRQGRNYRFYPEGPIAAEGDKSLPRPDLSQIRQDREADSIAHEPPVSSNHQPIEEANPDSLSCGFDLPLEDQGRITALVVLGYYSNEREAYNDLVKRGLESVLAKFLA